MLQKLRTNMAIHFTISIANILTLTCYQFVSSLVFSLFKLLCFTLQCTVMHCRHCTKYFVIVYYLLTPQQSFYLQCLSIIGMLTSMALNNIIKNNTNQNMNWAILRMKMYPAAISILLMKPCSGLPFTQIDKCMESTLLYPYSYILNHISMNIETVRQLSFPGKCSLNIQRNFCIFLIPGNVPKAYFTIN